MGLDQAGFLRSVSLLTEEVGDFGAYPFSIPAIRTLETLHVLALAPKAVAQLQDPALALIEALQRSHELARVGDR